MEWLSACFLGLTGLAVGTGLSRSDPPRIRKLDITDFTTFEALINEISPIVIVHRYGCSLNAVDPFSAAEKSQEALQDPSKREQANRLNVQVPRFLGNITKERGILLIYISTGYSPEVPAILMTQTTSLMAKILLIIQIARPSVPHFEWVVNYSPLNPYGVSKLKGEQAVMSTNAQSSVTLRVPILYRTCARFTLTEDMAKAETMNQP